MAIVTGIVPSPRREGRFDLVVDGKPLGVVSLELVERFRLRVGAAVDPSPEGALAEGIAGLATYDRALNMLASQARSARDLRRRLLAKKEPEGRVDAAIARLRAAGLLDDAAFARQFARSRVLGAGQSRRRVQQELYKRGVEREAIDGAVEEVFVDEGVDEGALVEQAARKKLRTLARLDAVVRRRRLYAFLARRGYDGDVIRGVMARLLGAAEAAALDDVEVGELGDEEE
jgi:regulatory protein